MTNIFNKREKILANEGLGDIDKQDGFGIIDTGDILSKCSGVCSKCIDTFIEGTNIRVNSILCCKSHPVTMKVNKKGTCPKFDSETGLCNVYMTEEYPEKCANYHCKRYGF